MRLKPKIALITDVPEGADDTEIGEAIFAALVGAFGKARAEDLARCMWHETDAYANELPDPEMD